VHFQWQTQKSGLALPRIIVFLAPRFILGIEEYLLALTAGLLDRFTGITEFGPPGPSLDYLASPLLLFSDQT
jgi:hypothetical protein